MTPLSLLPSTELDEAPVEAVLEETSEDTPVESVGVVVVSVEVGLADIASCALTKCEWPKTIISRIQRQLLNRMFPTLFDFTV
jgi:hypothetical protein